MTQNPKTPFEALQEAAGVGILEVASDGLSARLFETYCDFMREQLPQDSKELDFSDPLKSSMLYDINEVSKELAVLIASILAHSRKSYEVVMGVPMPVSSEVNMATAMVGQLLLGVRIGMTSDISEWDHPS